MLLGFFALEPSMTQESRPNRIALGLFFGLLFALACGPLGPLPGGHLSGELEPSPPSNWAFADDQKTVQLETNPSDPYSVKHMGRRHRQALLPRGGRGK